MHAKHTAVHEDSAVGDMARCRRQDAYACRLVTCMMRSLLAGSLEMPTYTSLSSRPGLNSAASSRSGRLVAPV